MTDFETRMAFAKNEPRNETATRREVALRVSLVTLTWLVSVSMLIGWAATGPGGHQAALLAASLAVFLPFVAAVIATKNRQVVVGGFYTALTLVMVLPAIAIVQAFG